MQVVTEGGILVVMLVYGMLRPRVEDGQETRSSGCVELIDFLDELVRKRGCGDRACDRFLVVASARREDFGLRICISKESGEKDHSSHQDPIDLVIWGCLRTIR